MRHIHTKQSRVGRTRTRGEWGNTKGIYIKKKGRRENNEIVVKTPLSV